MQRIKRMLTKEEFETLDQMTYAKQHEHLFPDGVPMLWECGYGYYGHKLVTDGKEYWVEFLIGNSCD